MTISLPFPSQYSLESDPIHRHALENRDLEIILGVPIDNLTMDETLDRVEQMVEVGRATGKTHQIATVNTDFLVRAQEDLNLQNLLQHADLCTADGMPLVWASKYLNKPLKERVAGSDMVPALSARAAKKEMTLYFMGAAPGVAAQAAEQLMAEHPGLKIVGHSCPFWKPGEQFDEAILQEIRTLAPDILLVALGNPKQELWIQEYGKRVRVPVMIGVGASLDFIVGRVKRAPEWMQKSGLEWVARLTQEPKRLWKRYANDLVKFVPFVINQWRTNKGAFVAESLTIRMHTLANIAVINVEGALIHNAGRRLNQSMYQALSRGLDVTLNFADVTQIDSTTIATLMQLQKNLNEIGAEFRIVGMKKPIAEKFERLRLSKYFKLDKASMVMGTSAGY
ncbi:MAG: WecB/TagA/CpsF family glycosyltransferase [Candidatus Promineifilaceae bacterium]